MFLNLVSSLPPFLSSHLAHWRFMVAHWRCDVKTLEKEVEVMTTYYKGEDDLPAPANLVLNCLAFNAAYMVLISAAGFSESFQWFSLKYIVIPQIIGGMAYYVYKYTWAACLEAFSADVVLSWLHNFVLLVSVALLSWEINFVYFGVTSWLEGVLPAPLCAELRFPVHVMELYFERAQLVMMIFGTLLFVTLPYWKAGYEFNMKLADRKPTMGLGEMAMELIYFTVLWPQHFQFMIPLGVILQQLGCRFLVLHFLLAMLEFTFINQFLLLKFEPMHMLMHRVSPLYRMTHYEHHICKSIHPTCGGAGTWELFAQGGASFFSAIHFHSLPYVPFFMLYGGVSLIGHQMANSKYLVQWHTLHHIIEADIYAGNLPSKWDEKQSQDFRKFKKVLESASPMIKYTWLPDAMGGLCFLAVMTAFHYGLGWSIVNVWDQRLGGGAETLPGVTFSSL
jgi:hypothetical protein